ncbi:serine/threonine protein kinase [Penicillium herquei]|nr:serine/threonine protein kinase [Penicillium herquei]
MTMDSELVLDRQRFLLKVFHDNGDPGYTHGGRDLNPFRCERNAYENLIAYGVCDTGFVPKYYGYIDQLDPQAFYPALQDFVSDEFNPKAILIEFFPDSEIIDCENYSKSLFSQAIEGIKEIHKAGVLHDDIYPKNLLLVRGTPDRLVWIDFDLATTFTDYGPEELALCENEVLRVKELGEALVQTSSLFIWKYLFC